MSLARDQGASAAWFRTWFPPLFFAAVALGTLPVIFAHLFIPASVASAGVARMAGREYAAVQLPAFDRNPWLIHGHAVIGLVVVILAPFQFWRAFRNRRRRLHRIMGYALISCLAVLSISGVAVTIAYPFSGIAGVVPNVLWTAAILFALGRAIACVRRRDLFGHENWMTRAMAVTFGITFASLYLPILNNLFQLPSRTALAVSFWLGVGECVAVGELWLRRPGRPVPRRR